MNLSFSWFVLFHTFMILWPGKCISLSHYLVWNWPYAELHSLLIYHEKSFIYLCHHTLFIIPCLLTEKFTASVQLRLTKQEQKGGWWSKACFQRRSYSSHLYFLAFSKMSSPYHFLLEGVAESKWHVFIIQTEIPALTISLLWPWFFLFYDQVSIGACQDA